MTEAEWLACADPAAMLGVAHGPTSPRRLRLLVTTSARRIWPLIPDRGRVYVDVLERCADGLLSADDHDLREAFLRTDEVWVGQYRGSASALPDAIASTGLSIPPTIRSTLSCLDSAARAAAYAASEDVPDSLYPATYSSAHQCEQVNQARFVRDIFGNPFRPVAFDPAWRTEAVVALARGAYDDRAFDRLPVLADALEDAGCADADVLAHCRGTEPHVRGCWVVDLVLGKS